MKIIGKQGGDFIVVASMREMLVIQGFDSSYSRDGGSVEASRLERCGVGGGIEVAAIWDHMRQLRDKRAAALTMADQLTGLATLLRASLPELVVEKPEPAEDGED